jgi:beta-glucosidase
MDSRAELIAEDTVAVTVTVTNTGMVAGKHVVQVYVSTTAGPVRRPLRELRAFDKIALQPGQTRRVELLLDRRAFAYWDIEQAGWVVAAGEYAVQVCADASTVVAEQTVTLAGDLLVRELTMQSTVGDWFSHPVVGPALMAGLTASMTPEQAEQAEQNPDGLKMVESMPMQQFLVFTNGAIPAEALEQLIDLSKAPVSIA